MCIIEPKFCQKMQSRNRKNEILHKRRQQINKYKKDENNIYANITSYIHKENMMKYSI